MPKKEDLDTEIRHALTEIRMVLPGVQALLGFQLITFVLTDFEKLAQSLKEIHVASVLLTTISVILLMTPASYHRIVEHGENSEHFLHFCSGMLLAALLPLALGICGDFYLVLRTVSQSLTVCAIVSSLLLIFFVWLWFGMPLARRIHDSRLRGNKPKAA
jgi:DMSO reductase anchor subunit